MPDSEKLFIDISRGFVKVEGWDKQEILLQGELDDAVKKLVFKSKGTKALIKVVPQDAEHWGDASVLKIFMPQSSKLYFRGVDTCFGLAYIHGGVEGKTISGDIMAKDIRTEFFASSMSGDIFVEDSSGKAQVESVSGELNFSGRFNQAKLKSMSGDIIANTENAKKLTIKNVSGNTQIHGRLQQKSDEAFYFMQGAIDTGWVKVWQAEFDPIFNSINNESQFAQMMGSVSARLVTMRVKMAAENEFLLADSDGF